MSIIAQWTAVPFLPYAWEPAHEPFLHDISVAVFSGEAAEHIDSEQHKNTRNIREWISQSVDYKAQQMS
ncbi:hypothetical protein [Aneurinibacillus soli]|uniref:hypothetical protein n=1 Tax=Aneurinibacillus soli TaxID=1500254 RepID=UPI0011B4B403|nr:hypothetical protein [Aneurinibacillus soli]